MTTTRRMLSKPLLWLVAVAMMFSMFTAFQPQSASAKTQYSGTSYTSAEAKADQIIATGKKFLGTPYVFGAPSGRTDIFDCSSFTQYVYGVNGIKLPRNSRQQSRVGEYVPYSQLRKGDLVFFAIKSSDRIDHVGIYMGNNKILHTFNKKYGVKITPFGRYWKKYYVGARRVIG